MGALRPDLAVGHVRRGVALARVDRPARGRVRTLAARADREAPALDAIARYDTSETLFYLDPPYVHDARGDASVYGFEMSNADHKELADALRQVRGRVVLSGYRTDLYDRLFAGWTRIDAPERLCHSVRKPRREAVWLNFR